MRLAGRWVGLGAAALVTAAGLPATPSAPVAHAFDCPDVEVIFARGTNEPPGLGKVGDAFVDSLRQQTGGLNILPYGVNYAASKLQLHGGDGANDTIDRVKKSVETCPNTKIVLGGYSQGAAVAGFVTSPAVPDSVPQDVDPATIPKPLDPAVANHVAAVVLFGTPNVRAMNFLGQPKLVIGPLYQSKTIQVCAVEDPVCSDGVNFAAHNTYADDGSVISQGVDFAASRLQGSGVQPTAPQHGFGN